MTTTTTMATRIAVHSFVVRFGILCFVILALGFVPRLIFGISSNLTWALCFLFRIFTYNIVRLDEKFP